MNKYLIIIFLPILLFSGCYNVPSTEKINEDIAKLELEIKDANETIQKYSGGLLSTLARVRLETLKTTKAMLEQKKKGIQRFIPLKYTIDGKEYSPPTNKSDLLEDLNKDLDNLRHDLSKAEMESSKYGGGLLGVLSLTQVVTVKNSIAFLNQRRLLLKYDIPFYSMVPNPSGSGELPFKPTPGDDINKF